MRKIPLFKIVIFLAIYFEFQEKKSAKYLVRLQGCRIYNGHGSCPQPTGDRMGLYRTLWSTDYS